MEFIESTTWDQKTFQAATQLVMEKVFGRNSCSRCYHHHHYLEFEYILVTITNDVFKLNLTGQYQTKYFKQIFLLNASHFLLMKRRCFDNVTYDGSLSPHWGSSGKTLDSKLGHTCQLFTHIYTFFGAHNTNIYPLSAHNTNKYNRSAWNTCKKDRCTNKGQLEA